MIGQDGVTGIEDLEVEGAQAGFGGLWAGELDVEGAAEDAVGDRGGDGGEVELGLFQGSADAGLAEFKTAVENFGVGGLDGHCKVRLERGFFGFVAGAPPEGALRMERRGSDDAETGRGLNPGQVETFGEGELAF